MAFQLEIGESPTDGIRRIALEQIDQVIDELTHFPAGRDKAVHNTRKSCKRLRALLRLVRDEIGWARYQQENIFFRDTSRILAPVRDSLIIVLALDAVIIQFGQILPEHGYAALREALYEQHLTVGYRLLEVEDVAAIARERMLAGRQQLADLPVSSAGFEAFSGGLTRVYRRGRRRMARAHQSNDPGMFHDWRKRVKYLWHQLEVLSPLWPGLFDQLILDLHQVSDYLGDAHDLVELKQAIVGQASLFKSEAEMSQLLSAIDDWQAQFEKAARLPGLRLYAESPDCFVDRVRHYWGAFQQERVAQESPSLAGVLEGPPVEVSDDKTQARFLSTRDAAERLGISPARVRRLIQEKSLSAVKVGGVWVIDEVDLESGM